MNPYFQEAYFSKHKLNKQGIVQLKDVDRLATRLLRTCVQSSVDHMIYRMTQDKYEEIIHELLK